MALPITVIGIDTDPDSIDLTRFAIRETLLGLEVEDVLFFGCSPLGLGERYVQTQRFDSIDTYSEFVLKCLWPFVATEFVLIVHWDGFVIAPGQWTDEFMAYDYIGAPWAWADDHMSVGNGGFCLRSRRVLQACKEVNFRRHPEIPYGGIEDILICRLYRSYMEERGIRFAPRPLAERFSYETGECPQLPFGFHGPANMPVFVPEQKLLGLAPALVRKIKPGPVRDLFLRNCLVMGYHELAAAMAAD